MCLCKKDNMIYAVLPVICLLLALFFMWSNNAHTYTVGQYKSSIGVLLIASGVLFFFNIFLIKLISLLGSKKNTTYFFYVIIAFFCAIILDNFLYHLVFTSVHYLISIVTFFVFFLLMYFKKEKILLFFLVILFLLISSKFCYFLYNNNKIINEENKKIEKVIDSFDLKPVFAKKPNVYMFWQESYQDYETIKRLYQYDNIDFINYLNDKNFKVFKNVNAQHNGTLISLTETYTMGKIEPSYLSAGQTDGFSIIRDIIGGNDANFVYKIFKDNGYEISFSVQGLSYYLHKKGKYLDEISSIGNDINLDLYYDYLPILSYSRYDFLNYKRLFNSYSSLLDKIKVIVNKNSPQFCIIKGGATHAPVEYTFKLEEREKLIKSNRYENAIKDANKENIEIINYIIEHDPDSIIILLGDHGAYSYVHAKSINNKIYDTDGNEAVNVTEEDVVRDTFNVLLALRLPNGEVKDISKGNYISNINLFLHIFSYMSDDYSLLKQRIVHANYLFGKKVFEDGHYLCNTLSDNKLKNLSEVNKIDFTDKDAVFDYVKLSGFSTVEPSGIWSDGPESELFFSLGEKINRDVRLKFTVKPLLSPAHEVNKGTIWVNGTLIKDWEFTLGKETDPVEILINKELINNDGYVKVTFKHQNAVSPFSLGINNDKRKLSLLFNSMEILEEMQ